LLQAGQDLGFNYLIYFHNFCGISYCGYGFKDQSFFKKIPAIAWNSIQVMVLINNIYNNEVVTRLNNNSNNFLLPKKSILLDILGFNFITISYISLFILHLLLMINSKKFFTSIRESENNEFFAKFKISEKRIALKIIILQTIYITSYVALHLICYHIKNEFIFNFSFITRLFQAIFFRANDSAVIALIAYKSELIRCKINYMKNNLHPYKFEIYFLTIINIKNEVKKLDKLFCSSIFVVIANFIIKQIIGICFLTIDFKNSYLYIFPHFLVLYILLITLCYVFNIIPDSMAEFSDCLKLYLVEDFSSSRSDIDIKKLYNLNIFQMISNENKKIYFTALGLYRFRTSSVLCILSVVISYSVILIQTSY
jgi:hypothetical protein